MNPIGRLIEMDRTSPKRVLVLGDAMRDVWAYGSVSVGQEGCLNFTERERFETPGGAANAAEQLRHWTTGYFHSDPGNWSVKTRRFDEQGRIVFRDNIDFPSNGPLADTSRHCALGSIGDGKVDAVLFSDYDKGFLTPQFIHDINIACRDREIPMVVDAKRPWMTYRRWNNPDGSYTGYFHCVIKCNEAYAEEKLQDSKVGPIVITKGARSPRVYSLIGDQGDMPDRPPVPCVNHVGAGDCFAAHLTLALAHGLSLVDAAVIAHSAGRVYVQHRHARAPWPHEIRKDLLPTEGKVLAADDKTLADLRTSLEGKNIVFTNGVFRLPHAGHGWLMRWAKTQGDVLVVGINDDASAAALKGGQHCRPLDERLEFFMNHASCDWIIPFPQADPCAIIAALRPDILVKGSEYAGQRVPGDDLVRDVRFAPPGPHADHATAIIEAIKAER